MPSFTQLEFRNILPETDEAFVAYDADDGFRLFKEVQDGIAVYFKEITEATPPNELLQFAGNATVLGNTTVKLENVTILNANQTVNGSTYTISKVGNSDFRPLVTFPVVIDNIPGVTFTANAVVGSGTGKLVSNVIQDESIVVGRLYKILSLGTTTNWNTVAGTTGITYKAGDWIVAAAAGAGDGTVASDFSYLTSQVGQIIKVGSTWARINKFIDEQTVQVDRPVTAGAVYVPRYYPDVMLDTIIGKITAELSQANLVAGNFVVGKEYIIVSLGDTAWNTAAGTTGVTYAVGDSFKAAAPGSGTGIAAPKYVVLTQTAFNVTSTLVDKYYEITALGTTTNAQWNSIAGTTGVTYIVGNVIKIANQNLTIGTGQVKRAYPAKPITVGKTYQIVELGTTNWNTVAGTTGVTYVVGSEFSVIAVPTTGNGIVSFYNIERYYENTTEIAQGDITIAGTYIGEPRLDSAGILKIWSGSAWVAASSNSRVVDLTASSQVFTYNSAGTSPTPASVTLTATASNTSGTVFYDFLVNDVSQQNTTTNTYVLTAPASIANRKVEVRIREGTNTSAILARDQTTIIGVQPGANGTNAVSGYLTNENHTVAADSAGAGYDLTNAGGTFNIFNGTTNVTTSSTFAIVGGTDGGGATWSKTQNGLTFTLNKTSGVYNLTGASPSWTTTNIEVFTVTGVFSGVTITQIYTITRARAGTAGTNGLNTARIAIYRRSASAPGPVPAGTYTYTFSTGVFTVNPTNWSTDFPTTGTDPIYVAYATASALTATVNITSFSAPVLFVANGTNGTNGTAAVNLNLSVNSMTVQAFADGTVPLASFTGVQGQCTVFDGTTDVTANAGVAFTFTATNCTGSVNTGTDTPVTGAKGSYRITAMTADTAFLTITATYNTIAYTRVFSVSKNKVGYEILATDPSTNLFQGRIYFNTATNKLRRYTGSVWTNAVDTTDLSGSITAAQIGGIIGGDNLLRNSSLESVDGAFLPYGWAIYNNAAISVTLSQVAGRLSGNAYSIRCNASTSNTIGISTNSGITGNGITGGVIGNWKPSTSYVVSYWAKKINGTGFTTMALGWNNAPTSTVDIANPTVTTTFQRYAHRIVTPATVEPLGALFIYVQGSKVNLDQLILDDVQVTEGDIEKFYAPRTDEILPNSVTNAQIAGLDAAKLTTQITTTQITDNAITTAKIGAGQVVANSIAANSITASRMVLTDSSNMLNDAEFIEAFASTGASWRVASGVVTQAITGDALATALLAAKIAKVTGSGITTPTNRYDYIDSQNARTPVEPNKPYYCSVDYAVTSGFNGRIYADIEWINAAGAAFQYNDIASANYWTVAASATVASSFFAMLTAPATAVAANFRMIVDWNTDFATRNKGGTGGFVRPRMRRAANAELIVDGSINAGKIATNAITADKILAGEITGAKIAGTTITGDKIAGTTITGDKIAGTTITGDKITAGAITASKINVFSNSFILDPDFSDINYWISYDDATTVSTPLNNGGNTVGWYQDGGYGDTSTQFSATIYHLMTTGGPNYNNAQRVTPRGFVNMPIKAGSWYELAARIFNASNRQILVYVEWFTNTGAYISDNSLSAAAASNLNNLRNKFQAPANAAFARIMGYKPAGAGFSGYARIAGLTFREANTASMIVDGTITANQIATNTITADRMNVTSLSAISANLGSITSGAIDLTAGSYVVRHGAGFGVSSDLVMWYGLSSIARASATKTNGVFTLATDGKVYFGATDLAVATAPLNATITSSVVFNDRGPSDTRTPTINVSPQITAITNGTAPYTYAWSLVEMIEGIAPALTNATTSQCTLYRANTLPAASSYRGTWQCVISDANGKSCVKYFSYDDYSGI